jgi:acetyltransferase-like isoleucine patch superfamily enzyme
LNRDHRPYTVKKLYRRLERYYADHFLRPQLESLGPHFMFIRPWHVEIFGGPIRIGRCVNAIASRDMKVRLSVWSAVKDHRGINIGDYCLICPGVRISSAVGITIGDGAMLAAGVYLTDSDWHDLYNRNKPAANSAPIDIKENVWIGDRATVCKGVTIGRNSIIGAGAVVVNDVPENCVAAGNPARVVKTLDPDREIVTRAALFKDPEKFDRDVEIIEWAMHKDNTFRGWLRYMLFPSPGD